MKNRLPKIHPKTNKLVTSVKDILKVSLDYCSDVLNNNPPAKGFEKEFDLKNQLHDIRSKWGKENEKETSFEKEELQNAIKKLAKKNKRCYDEVTKAGDSFVEAVYNLFVRVWEDEVAPADWECTTLVQIFKGKGLKEILENNRYVHTKSWMPKLFESILVQRMKPKIMENMTKFLLGGTVGHRP